jgi:hypothetical protein
VIEKVSRGKNECCGSGDGGENSGRKCNLSPAGSGPDGQQAAADRDTAAGAQERLTCIVFRIGGCACRP